MKLVEVIHALKRMVYASNVELKGMSGVAGYKRGELCTNLINAVSVIENAPQEIKKYWPEENESPIPNKERAVIFDSAKRFFGLLKPEEREIILQDYCNRCFENAPNCKCYEGR